MAVSPDGGVSLAVPPVDYPRHEGMSISFGSERRFLNLPRPPLRILQVGAIHHPVRGVRCGVMTGCQPGARRGGKTMKFHWFAEVTYPFLPSDFAEKHASAWVTLKHDVADPLKVGQT